MYKQEALSKVKIKIKRRGEQNVRCKITKNRF